MGPKAFLELPVVLGFGPATGPTLKTALCHIRTLLGCKINTATTKVATRLCWYSCPFRWYLNQVRLVRLFAGQCRLGVGVCFCWCWLSNRFQFRR